MPELAFGMSLILAVMVGALWARLRKVKGETREAVQDLTHEAIGAVAIILRQPVAVIPREDTDGWRALCGDGEALGPSPITAVVRLLATELTAKLRQEAEAAKPEAN